MARAAVVLALGLIFNAGGARAEDACPKMSSSDMDEQWQHNASRSSVKHFALGDQLECANSEVGSTPLICHTKPNAPANPSLIVMRMLMRGGSPEMRIDGYTAGDCSAFQDLMFQFKKGMTVQEGTNNSPPPR